MKRLLDWLDDRTGYRDFVYEALYERIPGGARWRYVWGSTLVFAFVTQLVTGIFLWMAYSPSAQTAWESVFYIQYEMQGGWLLRGLHHYTAQAMVVLLALHLMQVVIDGAYRAPREFNFWIGLILMQIVLALSLTGYLLPWDQKGFWATNVATNLLGIVPVVGDDLQRLVVGGPTYGHHTLTRFFALHAGVLPGLLIGLLVLHLALFRRHGLHAKEPLRKEDSTFWPDQVLRDGVACLAVLAVVLLLTVRHGLLGDHSGMRPGDYLGADLGAPADPASPYSAARPEWYFLFLFQFLKYFHGETEIYGAVVIPAAVMGVMFLMPLIGNWKLGHGFNILFVSALLVGIGGLTVQAMRDDANNESYLAAVAEAQRNAERAKQLAQAPQGIPAAGAISLLRHDPKTQGPLLFASSCASCHNHVDAEGNGIAAEEPSAPNLYGFASREWLAGLLDPERINTADYFGNTAHNGGDMASWVTDMVSDFDEDELADLEKVIAALSAQAQLPAQREVDLRDADLIEEGIELLKSEMGCTDCHQFDDAGYLGSAPDLTGYGSRDWIIGIISDPTHERYYGDNNDRMPAFSNPDDPDTARLTPDQIGMLADWLRGDWYEPESASQPDTDDPAADAPGGTSEATAPETEAEPSPEAADDAAPESDPDTELRAPADETAAETEPAGEPPSDESTEPQEDAAPDEAEGAPPAVEEENASSDAPAADSKDLTPAVDTPGEPGDADSPE